MITDIEEFACPEFYLKRYRDDYNFYRFGNRTTVISKEEALQLVNQRMEVYNAQA